MRKLSAALFAALVPATCAGALLATLLSLGTSQPNDGARVEVVALEDTAMKWSTTSYDDADPQLARQQAIEQARIAGILGEAALVAGGNYASLTATGDIASGFDDANLYGSLAGLGRSGWASTGGAASGSVEHREQYKDYGKNPWTDATKDRISTFAADVDTASYTLARKKLEEGTLPVPASVRVEEFVNYFKYTFPGPGTSSPFSVIIEAAPSPFEPARHIVRLGVATKQKLAQERLPANLVFLVDVSGSMDQPDKLPLVKQALKILTARMTDRDTVALVTYAGSTRVVLEPTTANVAGKTQIFDAINALSAGGSTAMGSGIDLAYERAVHGVKPGHISRVIVLSDGDANVGAHTYEDMLALIASRAQQGVTLSTVGFGTGNYNDHLMEQLADRGNGNNFYVDSPAQAERVFLEDLTANLEVVAKDVKLQVDFDPALVARYRLVGYENRDVEDHDFRNDKVDAGEVGAGHQVTALYEVELTKRGKHAAAPFCTIRIRYKQPTGSTAREVAYPMVERPETSFDVASADFRFAFAAAAFADVLRGGQDAEHWSLDKIRDVAIATGGDTAERRELAALIERARLVKSQSASQ